MTKLGTKDNPIRILVADNWGTKPHSFLSSAFPNVKFEVYVETPSPHPHGHMVAECICHMLPINAHAEIVFLPYLDLQSDKKYNWLNVIKSERDAGRPFHIANCSFGAHHGDKEWMKDVLREKWDEPHEIETARQKIGDTIVVFAAGNQDSSQRGKPELDNDINYPQRPLSQLENLFVIGACDKYGVPSLFSSDGKEVWAMYLGEGVVIFDPTKHKLVRVNGTSFASPFAAGNIAEKMIEGEIITEQWYLDYILKTAWLAEGWVRGEQHRKAGYGCMLPAMLDKEYFRREYMNEQAAMYEIAYFDFEKV